MRKVVPLVFAALAACGPAATQPTAPRARGDDAAAAARVRAFDAAEDEALRDLAAIDRRLAVRTRLSPRDDDLRRVALGALFADESGVAAVDGFIDPFSFEGRSRGLAAVKKTVDASPADLPAAALLERELLVRLVDEEIARLDEERRLPWSASALVRGIVETWTPPTSADQTAARDRWLTRRLDEVRQSLGSGELDVGRARELDDALDALEHKVDIPGFMATTGELVKLREALESGALHKDTPQRPPWDVVAQRLRAHVGVALSPEAIETALTTQVKSIVGSVKELRDTAPSGTEAVTTRAAAATLPSTECSDVVPSSRVRSMIPPPERIASCHLRHVASAATDPDARAAAGIALHDSMIVALWALDMARGSSLAQTTAKHHLVGRSAVDAQARLERIALARPVAAIAAGLSAALLAETPDPPTRARAWSTLGDVPLDIATTELRRPTP